MITTICNCPKDLGVRLIEREVPGLVRKKDTFSFTTEGNKCVSITVKNKETRNGTIVIITKAHGDMVALRKLIACVGLEIQWPN